MRRMNNGSYQDILRNELARRCAENSNYSLRAFAKHLDVEPAQLSRVLNGKQNISPAMAQLIAEKLFKRGRDKDQFISLVELAVARNDRAKELALAKVRKLSPAEPALQLQLDTFTIISEWYHFAILDLVGLHDFISTSEKIAAYLGITEIEAKLAIDRLMKLCLLENRDGRLVKTQAKIATTNGVPSSGLRKFHKQMILKAVDAIDSQSIDQRYLRTKTMSISRSELPKFIKLIEDFLDNVSKLVASAEAPQQKDALYQLNVQLFDLKKTNGKDKK